MSPRVSLRGQAAHYARGGNGGCRGREDSQLILILIPLVIIFFVRAPSASDLAAAVIWGHFVDLVSGESSVTVIARLSCHFAGPRFV